MRNLIMAFENSKSNTNLVLMGALEELFQTCKQAHWGFMYLQVQIFNNGQPHWGRNLKEI